MEGGSAITTDVPLWLILAFLQIFDMRHSTYEIVKATMKYFRRIFAHISNKLRGDLVKIHVIITSCLEKWNIYDYQYSKQYHFR